MFKEFWVDMHIHTCLSPCADSEMKPTSIVRKAKEQNLDIIAITDHNSTENVLAVKKCAEKEGLRVIAGIEITSIEEVHILGFFAEDIQLTEIQKIIYKNLCGENDENAFGEQIFIDEYDNVTGYNKKLLIGATKLSVEDIVKSIHELDGIAIASHIDREGFSIIGQLGFIPMGLELDALEISWRARTANSQLAVYGPPLVSFSDAHYLDDIGKSRTKFIMESDNIAEIKKALLNEDGRKVGELDGNTMVIQ